MRAPLIWAAVGLALAVAAAPDVAKGLNDAAPADDTDDGGASKSQALGFIGVAFSAVGFGSNFIVIKKYDAGDGMFFQFCMCVGILLTGFIYHLVLGCPPLQMPAMIGGVLWASGNVMCPIIIDYIGIGLGLSIWGAINMLTGWGTAHFGLFGVNKETVKHSEMNVAGAIVAVVSVVVYARVQTRDKSADDKSVPLVGDRGAEDDDEEDGLGFKSASPVPGEVNHAARRRLSTGQGGKSGTSGRSERSAGQGSFSAGHHPLAAAAAKKEPAGSKFVIGVVMSMVAGVLFGSCFTPAQVESDHAANDHCNIHNHSYDCEHWIERPGHGVQLYCKWDSTADEGKKCGGMPTPDVVLSQFLGIFLCSWLYFVVYGIYKWVSWSRQNPGEDIAATFNNGPDGGFMFVNVPLIIPGMFSGVIWAIAQIGWFLANENLGMAVAFPIVCATPAIIGNAWGFFVFDEIVKTPLNIGTLCFGMLLSVAAGTLTALSK